MRIGEKIQKLLKRRTWSQSRLAREIGVTPPAISRIVGGADTSTKLGIRIATSLQVDPGWLFDESLGWPPVDRPGALSFGDTELVEELARRREVIQQEIQLIDERLNDDRLQRLSSLAGRQDDLTAGDRRELETGKRDLVRLFSLRNQLLWLYPDQPGSPLQLPGTLDDILSRFAGLRGLLFGAVSEIGHVASPEAVQYANLDSRLGGQIRTIGVGEVVPAGTANAPYNQGKRDDLVPILRDASERREDAQRYIRARSGTEHTVAFDVSGAIVVCDPASDLTDRMDCLVSDSDGRSMRVMTGAAILSEHPEYRTSGARQRHGAKVWPIVDRFTETNEA